MAGISAVVLAGDRRGAKAILHENKAFLEFKGEPLLIHVLRALQRANTVTAILVVGPKARLEEMLSTLEFEGRESITVVEQRQNLLENGKAGYVHSLGMDYSPSVFNDLRDSEYTNVRNLFVSCDIPLVTPWEIDQFVESSHPELYDYCIGLTHASVMEYYYPSDGKPGIRMAYFHLAEGRSRHNNMHIAKPLKVHRMIFIEHMYLSRYQKKFTNMFKVLVSFLFAGHWAFRAVRVYIRLQYARYLYVRKGGGRLYERLRAKNTLGAVTECIGGMMDMKMEWVYTTYGGAVLDVDNANDLEVAQTMHDSWMEHQERIYQRGT